MKERTDQLSLITIKNSAKDTVKRMRGQSQFETKYFQKMNPIENFSTKHTKNVNKQPFKV